MAATRTQIYLTEEQRRKLDEIGRRRKLSLAKLIRDAVDAYLVAEDHPDVEEVLEATFGAVPEFEIPPRSELWGKRGSAPPGL